MLFYTMHQAPLELIAARDYINNLGDFLPCLFLNLAAYTANRNIEFQDQTACWAGLVPLIIRSLFPGLSPSDVPCQACY